MKNTSLIDDWELSLEIETTNAETKAPLLRQQDTIQMCIELNYCNFESRKAFQDRRDFYSKAYSL